MRGLCKEEDYAFLGMSGKTRTGTEEEGAGASEGEWKDRKEERIRWRQERERREKERLREIEESRKEKEQQWRTHVANLTSSQEKNLQDRLARLRKFREFQRKVLMEESEMEAGTATLTANQLLTRM
ncbi:U2 small nuclear ribonucleoprotein auxiliary factor 35 kDa subunit-related protein 1-like [Xyrichtys novacula]|nr:U2 small nuclear ribonucleoprotein auxiliary factor 35 kDa subunit-related protein 1-like [Xyrichtys novacula]